MANEPLKPSMPKRRGSATFQAVVPPRDDATTVRSGDVTLTWELGERIARMQHVAPQTVTTGDDALILLRQLDRWVGDQGVRFGVLADAANLARVERGWLAEWSTFFRLHADHASISVFHVGPAIRVAADLFRIGSGANLKMFAEEHEARTWLRQNL